MNVKLKRIPPLPAAKIVAAIYACLSLIFVPFMIIAAIAGAISQAEGAGIAAGMGLVMIIVVPLMYTALGFVSTLIACALYNFLAEKIGGIEMEFEETSLQST